MFVHVLARTTSASIVRPASPPPANSAASRRPSPSKRIGRRRTALAGDASYLGWSVQPEQARGRGTTRRQGGTATYSTRGRVAATDRGHHGRHSSWDQTARIRRPPAGGGPVPSWRYQSRMHPAVPRGARKRCSCRHRFCRRHPSILPHTPPPPLASAQVLIHGR